MSQRYSDVAAEAQHEIVLPLARKRESVGPRWRYRPAQGSAQKTAIQSKDTFANQTSQQARTMRAEIERVARRPFNILITGETSV